MEPINPEGFRAPIAIICTICFSYMLNIDQCIIFCWKLSGILQCDSYDNRIQDLPHVFMLCIMAINIFWIWIWIWMWIHTRVTVRKWLSWVLTSVALTFDLWPWLFACITSVIGNNSWKFHDDTMRGTLWKRCNRQTDWQTERSVLRAAWSQLKMSLLRTLLLPTCEPNFWTIHPVYFELPHLNHLYSGWWMADSGWWTGDHGLLWYKTIIYPHLSDARDIMMTFKCWAVSKIFMFCIYIIIILQLAHTDEMQTTEIQKPAHLFQLSYHLNLN